MSRRARKWLAVFTVLLTVAALVALAVPQTAETGGSHATAMLPPAS
jgi:uncharacterized membrane protein YdfJ with MMPL/SSD domain